MSTLTSPTYNTSKYSGFNGYEREHVMQEMVSCTLRVGEMLTKKSIHSSYSILPAYHYLRDDETFSFCAWYLGSSSMPRRMGKSQDKNDDVEVTVVAVLYVVAFLL